MSAIASVINAAERTPIPDPLARTGIHFLVGRTARLLGSINAQDERAFAQAMPRYPVALNAQDANRQHYEVPAEFFELILGPQRKYSCCLYTPDTIALAQAEEIALVETARNAGLADGQTILELGCGWGSLSLWMAANLRDARIVAVSNSHSQRAFIERQAEARQLRNLTIVTADMNDFAPQGRFDRVVSVEMFEHMSNWRTLLERVHSWLAPEGRFFMHIFTHRMASYRYDYDDKSDWIAQHFFTGGIMPGQGLIRQFPDLFAVEEEWRWSGVHYERTANHWLSNYDAHSDAIMPILRAVYGADAALWHRRWRLFFLATAGLFGYRDGDEWGVSHYRMKPV